MIDEVIERLKEAGTPFAIVGGANALADVTDRPMSTPAAYVYISAEASKPNQRMTGLTLQTTETDVAVVIVSDNGAGELQVSSDIESLKKFVRRRLVGFLANSALDPFEHVQGQVVQIKDRMVWFEDVFATAALLEEEP